MKHLKPLCIFILTLFFIRDSNAKIIEFNHDYFINNSIDVSTNNYDSSSVLTQEVLLKLSSKNELTEFYFKLSDEDLLAKRRIYLCYKYGNILQRLNCKLICVSDSGIFVYSKNSLTYIPYKYIKFIQRGISFGKQLSLATVAGAGFGFFYGIANGINGVDRVVLVAGIADFLYITIGGSIYLVSTFSDNYRAKIKFSASNGLNYQKKVLKKAHFYGNRMQIKDYPATLKTSNTDTIVPQNEINTTLLAQEKYRSSDSNKVSNNEDNIVIKNDDVEIPKAAPAQLKVEFPKLNTPTGKINPTWMYLSFNKLDVNEKKLMSKFKNIQGIQMIAENLQSLNPSELQFLAITITTLNGFDFKNVAIFSESQSQYLENYASYISNEVKSDTEIDPSNMQELDINNVKLIYSVLKAKMN